MKIILSPNPYRDKRMTVVSEAEKVLKECGVETVVCLPFPMDDHFRFAKKFDWKDLDEEAEGTDMLICFGGDGTILGVARHVMCRKIPMVCINFGRVGFLSDIEPENWEEGLKSMLASTEYRSAAGLRWALLRYGHHVAGGYAVNDVVLSRSAMARLVYANIYTDGELMGAVRADGFLLSSAIGSSGYSVSANGPLLFPTLNAIAFVPICPFLNTIPSMVFPTHTLFRFHLLPGTTESYLTVDGQEGHMVQTNDIIEVEGIPDCARFLGKGLSFIQRLRTRSFILQNPVNNPALKTQGQKTE